MEILSDDVIHAFILPFLSEGKRGFKSQYDLVNLVKIILYRLKTGCQWRCIPLKEFFGSTEICWQTVYYHWNKWCKDGCWETMWHNFLSVHKAFLDMSSIQVDGSHTPVKRGGEAVAYQGRKSAKTTNTLFLVDKRGTPLAMGEPQAGNHHDLFEIATVLPTMLDTLKSCNITLDGLMLNADPGFDAQIMKDICDRYDIFPNIKPIERTKKDNTDKKADKAQPYESGTPIFDDKLYKERSVVEHTNAWIDGFKMLQTRYETTVRNWKSLHFLAFIVIFQRKIGIP